MNDFRLKYDMKLQITNTLASLLFNGVEFESICWEPLLELPEKPTPNLKANLFVIWYFKAIDRSWND